MIDCENEVYTRIVRMLREEFPGINVAGEYTKTPSSFPHVSITQSDNSTIADKQDTSGKEAMGAMAAPLINALAPAIDFVIGKVVALFNILNQLFARLTGSKTYTAAKKVAATYGGAAKDAAGTASKAAKKAADEIKRYTLGFDELNILGDKNKDSSGMKMQKVRCMTPSLQM